MSTNISHNINFKHTLSSYMAVKEQKTTFFLIHFTSCCFKIEMFRWCMCVLVGSNSVSWHEVRNMWILFDGKFRR